VRPSRCRELSERIGCVRQKRVLCSATLHICSTTKFVFGSPSMEQWVDERLAFAKKYPGTDG
jgi:hypothetical protein